MELRHLRYLIAVAEELNFSRAAMRLRISQPPLSQQIRQLEEELGIKLFERTKRHVRLTEAGKRIVLEAQQILSQVDHFVAVASRVGEGAVGRLAVAGQAVLNEMLVQTLRVFAHKYPGVHIELRFMNTANQVEALLEEHVHVGFLHLPVNDTGLTVERSKVVVILWPDALVSVGRTWADECQFRVVPTLAWLHPVVESQTQVAEQGIAAAHRRNSQAVGHPWNSVVVPP